MYRLTQLALARKSVTLFLAAGVFVAGILAWGQLQAELLPDIDFPVATVIAVYPGAGTTDVAEQVSAPIERTLSSVQGVKSVRSTSSPSLAVVIAEFEYGTDIDAAVADIESNLSSAGLPPSVEPQVSTLNINAFPITSLTVQADDASVDVGKVVRDEVVPELAGLPGVASVSVTGGDLQRVNVILVRQAGPIQRQRPAGGWHPGVYFRPLRAPSSRVTRRCRSRPATVSRPSSSSPNSCGTYDVPAALPGAGTGQLPVDPAASPHRHCRHRAVAPTPVTLGDLGSVEYGPDPAAGVSRTDGKPSVGISVVKTSDANTVDVSKAVEAAMTQLDDELGLNTTYVYRAPISSSSRSRASSARVASAP